MNRHSTLRTPVYPDDHDTVDDDRSSASEHNEDAAVEHAGDADDDEDETSTADADGDDEELEDEGDQLGLREMVDDANPRTSNPLPGSDNKGVESVPTQQQPLPIGRSHPRRGNENRGALELTEQEQRRIQATRHEESEDDDARLYRRGRGHMTRELDSLRLPPWQGGGSGHLLIDDGLGTTIGDDGLRRSMRPHRQTVREPTSSPTPPPRRGRKRQASSSAPSSPNPPPSSSKPTNKPGTMEFPRLREARRKTKRGSDFDNMPNDDELLKTLGMVPGYTDEYQTPQELGDTVGVTRGAITHAANNAMIAKYGADVATVYRRYKRSARDTSWTPRQALEHALKALATKTVEQIMADKEKAGKQPSKKGRKGAKKKDEDD